MFAASPSPTGWNWRWLERQAKPDASRLAEAFFRAAAIVDEPVTLQQGLLAREAFFDYGRGRHRAGLDFGDCFAYALAKAKDEPLLFKGDHLRSIGS